MNSEPLHRLTTIDNPWNPWTNWDEWFAHDKLYHYNCCEKVALEAVRSDKLSVPEQEKEIEDAIQRIIDNDPFGIYIKIKKDDRVIPINIF